MPSIPAGGALDGGSGFSRTLSQLVSSLPPASSTGPEAHSVLSFLQINLGSTPPGSAEVAISRPIAGSCGTGMLGFQARDPNQRAHTFLGLSCSSRSRTRLCSQLRRTKPKACVFPESFASAVVVTHDDEIVFFSNEVTAVIKLLEREFETVLFCPPPIFFSSGILKTVKS